MAGFRRRGLRPPLLRRLERAAGRANPFLAMIVVGLLVLDLSCLAALRLAHLAHPAAARQAGLSPFGLLSVPYRH